jgi:hypothetical protein
MSKQTGERINQLTNAADYDVKRIVFGDAQSGTVANTPIVYRRINISTLNKDGSVGDLIFPTERLFSFGVSENKSQDTGKVNGHVLPLCLWNREGPSAAEKAWTDTFNRVVEQCKKHLLDNREEIEQYELSSEDLKKLNPLYWKKEKGKVVEGTGPTLYAKLIASKKHNKILSMFFNADGDTVDPLTLLGKYCYAKAAVKIESIFIGNKISLQVKLYEVEVEMMDSGMKPLMSRPKGSGRMLTGGSTNMNEMKTEDLEAEEDGGAVPAKEGSIHGSEEETQEEEKPKPKAVPKVPVRKLLKKVGVK